MSSPRNNGSLSAPRAHEYRGSAGVAPMTSRTAGISFPDRSDMISKKWTPVERNTLWREHVKKEVAHSSIRTAYTRDPRTMVLITEKPQHRKWSPSSPTTPRAAAAGAVLTPLSPRSPRIHIIHQPHTGPQAQTASGVSSIVPHPPAAHVTDEKESPPVQPATAAAVVAASGGGPEPVVLPQLPIAAVAAAHREDDELLAALRHAELTPRDKFAYPTTSNHEYGWNQEALIVNDQTDIERNHRGKRLCPITQYANAYYVQQKMNPFSINAR